MHKNICTTTGDVTIEELTPTTPIPAKEPKPIVLMIDDFEDADFNKYREWWLFGKVMIDHQEIEQKESF